MSNPEHAPEFISDDAAYEFAQARYDQWKEVKDFPEELSNHFAFHLASWVIDAYEDEARHGSMHYHVKRFSGEELPESLRIMVRQEWQDGTVHFSDDNRLRMRETPEFTYIPAQIPKWDEVKALPTFQQQLAMMAGDLEICSGIILPKVIPHRQVMIDFEPSGCGWGLQFRLTPDASLVAPFGEVGKTWPAAEYVASVSRHPRVLSETAAGLAVLAAKHHRRTDKPYIPTDFLQSFERRLLGEESLPVDTSSFHIPPGFAIQSLLLNELAELGKIQRPGNQS